MSAAFDAINGYVLAVAIAAGLVWVIDRFVFGINAPGLFA
jgi:hypothetical protein